MTGAADPTAGRERLRELADNLEWAGGSETWKYEPDAEPDSAYAVFVGLCSPAVVLALIAEAGIPSEERAASPSEEK